MSGKKIIDGVNDAIAFVRGDDSRGRIVHPTPLGHASDCAVHNEPALPKGPCNCTSASTPAPVVSAEDMRKALDLAIEHAEAWIHERYHPTHVPDELAKLGPIRALLATDGPIAAMQAEHQQTVERLEARLAEVKRYVTSAEVQMGNVIYNAEQLPRDHETHLRAWRDIYDVVARARASLEAQLSRKETNDVG